MVADDPELTFLIKQLEEFHRRGFRVIESDVNERRHYGVLRPTEYVVDVRMIWIAPNSEQDGPPP